MTPTQIKEIEKKIDRLEKKLDFVIHHYIQVDVEDDWIDDPKIVAMLDEIATKEESISEDEVNF